MSLPRKKNKESRQGLDETLEELVVSLVKLRRTLLTIVRDGRCLHCGKKLFNGTEADK